MGKPPNISSVQPPTVSDSHSKLSSERPISSRKSEIDMSPSSSYSPSAFSTTSFSTSSVSSQMSPTISSSTSSIEMTPSVPPYSSVTMARCFFARRNSARTCGSFMVL